MKIAFLGDIALIGRYDKERGNNVEQRVSAVKQLVSSCDVVIANLESPFTIKESTRVCKGIYIRSNPVNVETLKYIGVTHVSLANNHIYDYGAVGAKETKEVLTRAGIQFFGLCNGPSVIEKKSNRVMIDGFCCLSANATNYGTKEGDVHLLTEIELENYFRFAEKNHAIPIASIHYGIEGVHYPSKEHIKLFRKFAENHNYILHGNHPHAVQGIEKKNESLLFYAQGDLCFDDCEETSIGRVDKRGAESRKSYIAIVDIDNNSITNYSIHGISDSNDCVIKTSTDVNEEIAVYSSNLNKNYGDIAMLRRNELEKLKINLEPRNFNFFLNRLNVRYVGAYIKGVANSMKYNKVFKQYID